MSPLCHLLFIDFFVCSGQVVVGGLVIGSGGETAHQRCDEPPAGERLLAGDVRREATSVTVAVAEAALRGEACTIEIWMRRSGEHFQVLRTFCFYFRDVVSERCVSLPAVYTHHPHKDRRTHT